MVYMVVTTNTYSETATIVLRQIILVFVTGKLHLMSKTTKVDKSIDAHEGNVTVGKWSPDGSTLLTG